ncbi:hypothetical protein ACOSQ2_030080 [Xanthoceras sorbifolium]
MSSSVGDHPARQSSHAKCSGPNYFILFVGSNYKLVSCMMTHECFANLTYFCGDMRMQIYNNIDEQTCTTIANNLLIYKPTVTSFTTNDQTRPFALATVHIF